MCCLAMELAQVNQLYNSLSHHVLEVELFHEDLNQSVQHFLREL